MVLKMENVMYLTGKSLFEKTIPAMSDLFVGEDQKAGLDLYYEIHPTEVLSERGLLHAMGNFLHFSLCRTQGIIRQYGPETCPEGSFQTGWLILRKKGRRC